MQKKLNEMIDSLDEDSELPFQVKLANLEYSKQIEEEEVDQ